VYIIESQIDYIVDTLNYVHTHHVERFETTPESEQEYVDSVAARAVGSVWLAGGCNNWYVDRRTQRLTVSWPDFAYQFRQENATFNPTDYVLESVS
jgi:hypothetical protein